MFPLVRDYSRQHFLAMHFAPLGYRTDPRVLNAGSKGTRLGTRCLNVDIAPGPNVDLVCDLHDLPDTLPGGPFDVVVCSAVLQYCRDPEWVLARFRHHLKTGGLLYLSVPWVQPYNADTPDRWRFSLTQIRELVEAAGFRVIQSGPSIRAGSALYDVACRVAGDCSRFSAVRFLARTLVGLLLAPVRYLRTNAPTELAGGFYVVAERTGVAQ